MNDLAGTAAVDLLTPERVADPYPVFAELRRNRPVFYNEHYRAWFILRHDHLLAALKDTRFSSDRIRPVFEHKLSEAQRRERAPTYRILGEWMVFRDPPDHTRLRQLVSRAFTPRAVARWQPRILEVVDSLLAELAPRGRMDVISDFAYPLPAVVIAEMMGVPATDRDLFKDWSDDLMVLVFGARGTAGRRERAQSGLLELSDYLSGLVRRFRAAPAANLISALIRAQEGDERLTDDEITGTCILLLFGGHETTTNLIGNGLHALLRHPEELERLVARSDADGLRAAIEEILRFDGPSKMQVRMAATDIDVAGHLIRRHDMVYLVQAAANRDPDVFADPDRFDLQRNPTDHVGFGFGLHYCLGAAVARLEGSIALDALARRLPDLRGGPEPPEWHPTLISRGMASFPVSFTPSDGGIMA
ncbi:MAG: cytochrome P450 [bacterium]|nr:cytochrome P450 [bacterium]MYB24002.1 cytochrome P450 [Acidimicrobiia bacterium]